MSIGVRPVHPVTLNPSCPQKTVQYVLENPVRKGLVENFPACAVQW
jgi:hypothetical protein